MSETQNSTIFRQFVIPTTAQYRVLDRVSTLMRLGALNFFVGRNNSGKSRLLRALFKEDQIAGASDSDEVRSVEKFQDFLFQQSEQKGFAYKKTKPTEDDETQYRNAIRQFATAALDSTEQAHNTRMNAAQYVRNRGSLAALFAEVPEEFPDAFERIKAMAGKLERLPPALSGLTEILRVYIPAVRTLRSVPGPPADNKGRHLHPLFDIARRDYFADRSEIEPMSADSDSTRRMVFSGLEFHGILKSLKLGSYEQQQHIKEFERFLSKWFFDDQQIFLTPNEGDSTVRIKIGSSHERAVHDLGDGVQQLILLTFPRFVITDRPMLMFVEEPELYLHPGMQRRLVEAWLSMRQSPFQIFASTHSHQFLDMTMDTDSVSVFKNSSNLTEGEQPSRDTIFTVENWSASDRSLLTELGVHNSSVLLVNATIWVEGITDRLYLKRYIQLVQEEVPAAERMREDTHFSFVEYAGSNITHWSFLDGDHPISVDRLCARAIVVVDQDGPEKTARHKKLQERLGDLLKILPVREVENLLSPAVLSATVTTMLRGRGSLPVDRCMGYGDQRLGSWIDKHLEKSCGREPRQFAKEKDALNGSTIGPKTLFCETALGHLGDQSSMSTGAIELARSLVDFVRHQNHLKPRAWSAIAMVSEA